MRKRIALFLFDIGTGLQWLGNLLHGSTDQHRQFDLWLAKIERRALAQMFDQNQNEDQ
jgi:hypothetical protein